jgi:hypothetical protein
VTCPQGMSGEHIADVAPATRSVIEADVGQNGLRPPIKDAGTFSKRTATRMQRYGITICCLISIA